MLIIDCPVLSSTLHFSGDGPGREEGDSPAVQAEGQVLPWGRGRGADPGRHPEAFLPAGEGGHSVRGDLLPSRVRCPARLLRRAGQVRRVQTDSERARLPVLRAPAAQEVRSRSRNYIIDLWLSYETMSSKWTWETGLGGVCVCVVQLCRSTQTVYMFTSWFLISGRSSQGAGTTQAVQGAVGGENPGLAWGARSHAEVSDEYLRNKREWLTVARSQHHDSLIYDLKINESVWIPGRRPCSSTWRLLRIWKCTASTTSRSRTRRPQTCGWESTLWDWTSTRRMTGKSPLATYLQRVLCIDLVTYSYRREGNTQAVIDLSYAPIQWVEL